MKQLQPQLLKDNLAYYPLLCCVDVSGLFVVADAKEKKKAFYVTNRRMLH